jgi:hypothetical protein
MFEAGVDRGPGLRWCGKDTAAVGAVPFPLWLRVVALVTATVAATVAATISTAMATTVTAMATSASATVRTVAR